MPGSPQTYGIDAFLRAALPAHSDRIAFRCGSASVSYADLDHRARALAAQLRDLGVSAGDRIGIAMTKGVEMPIAIHAIWMAGAAFVPLDPMAPPARLASVIKECDIGVLVGAPRSAPVLEKIAALHPVIILGADVAGADCHQFCEDVPVEFVPAVNHPDDMAYIMFTSGSTGAPKGMVHTHGSGRAFVQMWADLYDLRADDVFFTTTPLHFDFSLADFFAGPIAGATTELVPEALQTFPASVSALLEKSRATIWSTVPFSLMQVCDHGAPETRDFSRMRWIIYGGEPMPPHHIKRLRDTTPAEISNSYGPAEVNQVTEYTVPHDHPLEEAVPIGTATPHAYLRRDEGDGTLLVAASSMMRGYWNRPDLDAKVFTNINGTRFYRTGDLASQGVDGLWRFGGRADRQIKLRGYRVELDEVEHALAAHPAVSEVAAVLSADRLTLTGFVTVTADQSVDEAELKMHTAALVPAYAVPARIVIRDNFPRTGTGKLDRKALVGLSE